MPQGDPIDYRYWPADMVRTRPTPTFQSRVEHFMQANDMPVRDSPSRPPREIAGLWARLVDEEFQELMWEIRSGELTGIAQEAIDLIWVVLGLLSAHGIDAGPVFEEVYRANMSKLGPDGRPILRADGKILKGPGFKPADIQSVLTEQGM